MASIPSDIILEILARSPVKDLLRFRCVSKYFKSLIDCTDFANLHLSHSHKINPNLYSIDCSLRSRDQKLEIIDLEINEVSEVRVNPRQGFEPDTLWEVVGSCNGLIALCKATIGSSIFSIWNPLNGKVASSFGPPYSFSNSYGFGYDAKTDDYKLVRILEYRHSENSSGSTLKTFVYSLKANSWKEIRVSWPVLYHAYRSCPEKAGIFVNNAMHWEVFDQGEKKIVAFDFINEEFYYLPVSGCFQFEKWIRLSVLDGCLAVTCRFKQHDYVYVMKEYGVKESWTNVLSYLSFAFQRRYNIYPVAYSERRDKILFWSDKSWYWYDLVSKQFDDHPHMHIDEYGRGGVKSFTGSLIAPDNIWLI